MSEREPEIEKISNPESHTGHPSKSPNIKETRKTEDNRIIDWFSLTEENTDKSRNLTSIGKVHRHEAQEIYRKSIQNPDIELSRKWRVAKKNILPHIRTIKRKNISPVPNLNMARSKKKLMDEGSAVLISQNT